MSRDVIRLSRGPGIRNLVRAGLLILTAYGCSDPIEWTSSFPNIMKTGSTVVALNESDDVLDFVHIPADSRIVYIEFTAPRSGGVIRVGAIGPNLPKELRTNFCVGSTVGRGDKGAVTVHVSNGVVRSILGSMVGNRNIVSRRVLQAIHDRVDQGDSSHHPSTTIFVADENGHWLPMDITAEEKAFFETMMSLLRKGEMNPLLALVDGSGAGAREHEGVRQVLAQFLSGRKYRYVLGRIFREREAQESSQSSTLDSPVGWVLDGQFTLDGIGGTASDSLYVVKRDGRLMISAATPDWAHGD